MSVTLTRLFNRHTALRFHGVLGLQSPQTFARTVLPALQGRISWCSLQKPALPATRPPLDRKEMMDRQQKACTVRAVQTDTDTDTGVRDTTTRARLATWPTISRDYWPLSRTIDPATWHDVLGDMAALLRLGCDKLKTCIAHQPGWWKHACAVTAN